MAGGLNPDSNSGFKWDCMPAADGEVPKVSVSFIPSYPSPRVPHVDDLAGSSHAPTPRVWLPPMLAHSSAPGSLWVVDDKLPAAPPGPPPGLPPSTQSARASGGHLSPGRGLWPLPRRRATLAVEPQRCWAGGRQGASRDCAAALRTGRLRAGAQRGAAGRARHGARGRGGRGAARGAWKGTREGRGSSRKLGQGARAGCGEGRAARQRR